MAKWRLSIEKVQQMLLSIGLAALLWAVALSNANPMVTRSFYNVPIAVVNQSALETAGLSAEPVTTTVNLKLRAQNAIASAIKKNDLLATIDVGGITESGMHEVPVAISGISDDVMVTTATPSTVNVQVSNVLNFPASITIDKVGSIASGFALLSVRYEPTVAIVKGSELVLQQGFSVKGELNVQDRNGDFAAQVALRAYTKDGERIDRCVVEPGVIDVDIKVGKIKTVPVKVEIDGECASGFFLRDFTFHPTEISIAGKEEALSQVVEIKTNPVIMTDRTESFNQYASIETPPEITLVNTSEVRVELIVAKSETKTFDFGSVQVLNTPPGLSASIAHFGVISCTFEAEPGVFENVAASDFKLILDLAGLNVGTHVVQINLSKPNGVFLKEATHSSLRVTLSENQ